MSLEEPRKVLLSFIEEDLGLVRNRADDSWLHFELVHASGGMDLLLSEQPVADLDLIDPLAQESSMPCK